MINPYNFTRTRFSDLSTILCKNCRYHADCFNDESLDDCDTYTYANDNMKDEEDV
jgi:hypothetical protein